MAEFLLELKDKTNAAEPVKNNQLYRRGDVIVIMPDGHPWSVIEKEALEWRILQAPGDPEAFVSLVQSEINTRADWLRRLKTLDLENASWSVDEKNEFDYTKPRAKEVSAVETAKLLTAVMDRKRADGGVIEIN
jgi:hypothetical protein